MIRCRSFLSQPLPVLSLRSSTALTTGMLALTVALVRLAVPDALANPEGGSVVAGDAVIESSGPDRIDVNQTSNRAAINWKSFSIQKGEVTNFNQPSADAVTLNRVTGGDLSTIAGRLTANGKIILVNPNGVMFTGSAEVDVGGLLATTSRIATEDFMAGRYRFTPGSSQGAAVINHGRVSVGEGGLAAFVAPWVENSGVIAARLGRVELASGDSFTIDLHGDGLIQLALENDPGGAPALLASHSAVSNAGRIEADGGVVGLTVGEAQGIVDRVVNMSGVVRARTVGLRQGRIILGGNNVSTVVSGTLDASGRTADTIGGHVVVAGRKVGLTETASIDVSGQSSGGKALIGGDFQGAPPIPAFRPAQYTVVSAGARINADARDSGDGGMVVAWADQATSFRGNASARGGIAGGDGGLIETSGKIGLDVDGAAVDASAVKGQSGNWLLDPINITIETLPEGEKKVFFVDETGLFVINDNALGSTIDPKTIVQALSNHTDVTITTAIDDRQGETGIITIQDSIITELTSTFQTFASDEVGKNATACCPSSDSPPTPTLRLIADDTILFNASVLAGLDDSSPLNIQAQAGHDINFVGGQIVTTGDISLVAGANADGSGGIINNLGALPALTTTGNLVLVADSGIGTAAQPLRTSGIQSLSGQTNTQGIFIEVAGNSNLYVNSQNYEQFDVVLLQPPAPSVSESELFSYDNGYSGVYSITATVTVNSKTRLVKGLRVLDPIDGGDIQLVTNSNLYLGADVVSPKEVKLQALNGNIDYGTTSYDSPEIVAASAALSAANGVNVHTDADILSVNNSISGDVSLHIHGSSSIDITQAGGGFVDIDGTDDIKLTKLVAPGSDVDVSFNEGADGSLRATAALGAVDSLLGEVHLSSGNDLELTGVFSNGKQVLTGGVIHLTGSYDTGGKDFIANGPVVILADQETEVLIDALAGETSGTVTFNDSIDGTSDSGDDITIHIGDSSVSFKGDVGGKVPLGVLEVDGLESAGGISISNAITDEDQAVQLLIKTPAGVDPESLALSNIPIGSTISDGNNPIVTTAAEQVVDLAAFDLDTLSFKPPANVGDDISINLVATVPSFSIAERPDVFNVLNEISGASAGSTASITVNPIADKPVLSGPSEILVASPSTPLPLSVVSPDIDGSEALAVTIFGLPPGVSLSAGIVNEDGSVTVPVGQLSGLELTVSNFSALPASLTLQATSAEQGSEISSINQSSPFVINIEDITPPSTLPTSSDPGQSFTQDFGQQGPIGDNIAPNRTRDVSPINTASSQDESSVDPEDPFAVEPAAGEEGVSTGLWEACPDVADTSVSWQNTAPDAAFNVDPDLIPYSVDVYCGGYQLTAAGRGSARDYQGLSFVTTDFWTDHKQEKTPALTDELRRALFLDDIKK